MVILVASIAGGLVALGTIGWAWTRFVIAVHDSLDSIRDANEGVREVVGTMRKMTRQNDRRFRLIENRLDRLDRTPAA